MQEQTPLFAQTDDNDTSPKQTSDTGSGNLIALSQISWEEAQRREREYEQLRFQF